MNWTFLTVAGLAAGLGAGAATFTPQGSSPRVIRIAAERFSFAPSRITLDVGEEVELRLRSEDTSHGFHILGTDIDVVIPKRGPQDVSVRFKATEPGRYTFECSHVCGAGHDFMRGELVVRSAAEGAGRR